MNFSQLHERLRLELLGRIEQEVLTASLLARKAGLQQPHISNFLRNKRRLSLPALDRVLAALGLTAAELLPSSPAPSLPETVPLVSQQVAMDDDTIHPASVTAHISLPPGASLLLQGTQPMRRTVRERFVAVDVTAAQALPMEPRLSARSIVVLDRHAPLPAGAGPRELHESGRPSSALPALSRPSKTPARLSAPPATRMPKRAPIVPTARTPPDIPFPPPPGGLAPVYAVRLHGFMHFCYVSFERNLLVLRPHAVHFPVQLLPVPPSASASQLVTGRVCISISWF